MVRPVVLIILDGWGYSPETRGNAVAAAVTPTIDRVERFFPFTLLQASGISVGLPWNEPGNSEVGHMNMGTGSIRYQPLTRINKSILDGSFFRSKALLKAAEHVRKNKGALHLMGLFSSGSVHAYRDHVHALLEFAQHEHLDLVFLHLFLDGRDGPPREGAGVVKELLERLDETKEGYVSSVIGRHYAMNRDGEWALTERAYNLITKGKGSATGDLVATILGQYGRGTTDEYMEPIVFTDPRRPAGRRGIVQEGDSVIFFNFREDSARQLTYAFVEPNRLKEFTAPSFRNLFFVTMTQYAENIPTEAILSPLIAKNTVSELVSAQGWKQFKIAETEKYAHVTYFFNGGREEPFPGEERILIPSQEVYSHADAPQMQAQAIGKQLLAALDKNEHHFLVANFANADMLAHTGNFDATRKGVETIDRALGPIIAHVLAKGGACIVTADHGHAEVMLDIKSGQILTAHSRSSVPFYLIHKPRQYERSATEQTRQKASIEGILSDVAATVLDLLDLTPPAEIEGKSLLARLSP